MNTEEKIDRLEHNVECLKIAHEHITFMNDICNMIRGHTEYKIVRKYMNEEDMILFKSIVDKIYKKHREYLNKIGFEEQCEDQSGDYCLSFGGLLAASRTCSKILKDDDTYD